MTKGSETKDETAGVTRRGGMVEGPEARVEPADFSELGGFHDERVQW